MLTRWDPFSDIDRISHRIFGERGSQPGTSLAVDVFETEDEIELCCEMPGLKPEDVKIDVTDNVLTLTGERRLENEDKREGYRRIERTYGSFSRSFTLPRHVDAENIQAELTDGVLHVKLPKQEEEKSRKVEVKAGAKSAQKPEMKTSRTTQKEPQPPAKA
jgi:HSP20 family protein